MTQARLLQLKSAAAVQGNAVLNEVVDQCLKVKRQMLFFDPTGKNVEKMLDVRHYKWLVTLLAVNGHFPNSIPPSVRQQIAEIATEMGDSLSE